MASGVVAVVGRPNVGKSTLFNRLVGERTAIVEDVPGTTRDRIYGTVDWRGREFSLVDTGGIDEAFGARARREDTLDNAVRRQVEAAIDEADVVLFVVDSKTGLMPVEHDVADRLRRAGKATLVVANKSDGWRSEAQAAEFHSLGLGEPFTVSAIQGMGTGDLLDAVVERLPPDVPEDEAAHARVAIIGRPNVGKSSFLNALVGSERAVVSETPGTTRDTIDTTIERDGQRIVLVDTAGIRRRGRVEEGIEKYALLRTVHALERADVAICLTDATEGITAQDTHIAGYAIDAGVGLVVGLNKWDAVEASEEHTERAEAELAREFHFAPWLVHRFVSAKTGRNVDATLADAVKIAEVRRVHVPTAELHRLLTDAIGSHPPPTHRGRSVRFSHVTQADARRPTFVFFVDKPEAVHFSYQRYLENRIRERFGFAGTPIKIELRGTRE
ncbi:MAG TPA: ribosome biogenesis GTPase Der [Candidatus Limnocylindria bacterium]|nr:ribosome biogenesis GTPase Der [Candidatus Limnocylindria bacterium]